MGTRRGVVLDRDGTLIDVVRDAELGVVTTAFHPRQVALLPGVVEGLRALSGAGFVLAVATNQPGAAKGQVPRSAIEATNAELARQLEASGIRLEAFEVCLHHPEGRPGGDASLVVACACRKPKPGMLLAIVRKLDLDPASSWMIGDSPADVEAARAAGLRSGLVADPARCELCPMRPSAGFPGSPPPELRAARISSLAEQILALGGAPRA